MPSRRDVLVVEGGGLRGAFSAGALAELARQKVLDLEACFATSSGAPSAAYLVTGQSSDAVRIWEDHTSGSQLIAPRRLLRGASLMDLNRLINVFRQQVPLNLDQLSGGAPLFVTVTNCLTAQAEHLRCTKQNGFALLEATMALPLIYGPTVSIDGVPYIDGGLTDSVPLTKAMSLEAQRVIVVLTQPKGYRKRPAPKVARLLALYYRQYPALATAFQARAQRYNECQEQLEQLEQQGLISVIRPASTLPATRLSRDRTSIVATLQSGRNAAQDWIARSEQASSPSRSNTSALHPI